MREVEQAKGRRAGDGPRRAATAGLLAAALVLPWADGGCFLLHRAKPQPPALVINQPIILSSAPVVDVPTPPPPAVVPPPLKASASKSEEGTVRRSRRPIRTAHLERPEKEAAAAPPPPADAAVQPQLTTKLSPSESEARLRSTNEWLDAAQHDLHLIAGRRLPADQEATRSQANEYIHQAQQALAQGDLVRAQNLAHKALVLAEAILESS